MAHLHSPGADVLFQFRHRLFFVVQHRRAGHGVRPGVGTVHNVITAAHAAAADDRNADRLGHGLDQLQIHAALQALVVHAHQQNFACAQRFAAFGPLHHIVAGVCPAVVVVSLPLAAFLGDSLTAGFCANEYNIDVGGALICGYRSISPNTIVNRTTVTSPDRGEEVALDVLAANQPAKLYLLLGTNALVQTGNEDSFINYYARMLDELRAALPNTTFYVQSILCATQETVEDDAPGLSPDHIGPINQQIKALCEERGLYYLDLNAEFSDENGYLLTDYAQPDGIHLTVSGYNKWVSYLCTHTPYSKNNPYQPGSTYYLSEEMQSQLADLP